MDNSFTSLYLLNLIRGDVQREDEDRAVLAGGEQRLPVARELEVRERPVVERVLVVGELPERARVDLLAKVAHFFKCFQIFGGLVLGCIETDFCK